MIKNWEQFNEADKYKPGEKIKAKIDLLTELSFDLTDIGLKVEIWSSKPWDADSKFIIMMIKDEDSILDEEGYYENSLDNKQEIIDFENTLVSFKMVWRKRSSGSDMVYYYFDKQGKMTDSPALRRRS